MPVDINELPLRLRIEFLCEQVDIVAQALEQGAYFTALSLRRVIAGQPNVTGSPSARGVSAWPPAHLQTSNCRQASSIKTSFARTPHQRRSSATVVVIQE
jgi:hypothetical protein